MRRIFFDTNVETTGDCISLINQYKIGKWKRVTKFNIKIDNEETHIVRIFTDGDEIVSIVSTGEETFLFPDDLSSIKNINTEIQKYAKNIYTHDYGDIYYNPWEHKVWVVGGDGGIFHSEKKPKDIIKILEEEGWDDFNDDIDFNHIDGVDETLVEGEYSPDEDNEEDGESGYILIGRANDLGNFEEF